MRNPWRPFAIAAALHLTAGAAAAQTVIATNAPAGSKIEFVLNSTPVGSAAADAAGNATIAGARPADAAKPEFDAHIYVDACDAVRRILVVDRTLPLPPQEAGCTRNQIAGLFLVRPVSTLVVNVGTTPPTVLLRQGRYTLRRPGPARVWTASHRGLVVFGGGGLSKFRDVTAFACGDVVECSGDDGPPAYTVGAGYWFSRFFGAQATYLKPAEATVSGTLDTVRFESFLDAHIVTVGGVVGVPIGRARLFGQVGTTYHSAKSGTTQTIEGATPGTQTYELKTEGWGWAFGGGLEVWLGSRVAIYTEVSRAVLKGDAADEADGALDEGLTSIVAGLRIRIGR